MISSACPAIVRLIQVSYPSQIGNIVDVLSPWRLPRKLPSAISAGSGAYPKAR